MNGRKTITGLTWLLVSILFGVLVLTGGCGPLLSPETEPDDTDPDETENYFEFDFSTMSDGDLPEEWRSYGLGTWEIIEERLKVTAHTGWDGGYFLLPGVSLKNFALSFDFNIESIGEMEYPRLSVLFRHGADGVLRPIGSGVDAYELVLFGTPRNFADIIVEKKDGGKVELSRNVFESGSIDTGQTYSVRLEVMEDEIDLYLNDVLVYEYTLEDTLDSGSIGFRFIRGCIVHFGRITVEALP